MTVSLDRVPEIPALARGVATGTPDVTQFLPRPKDLGAIAAQAASVRRAFRPREGAPGGDARLASLRRGETVGVFTGQQVGLFGGPHLTLVKALAAEKVAQDLVRAGEAATGAFWCASEDHDLVEVTRVVLPTADGPRDLGPEQAPLVGNRAPVGALRVPDDAARILHEAARELGSPPDEEALAVLEDAHRGRTYFDAFTRTLGWLLGGSLPFVDAADAADKPALVPLAVRLVKERRAVREQLRTRAAALTAAGYALQVTGDPAALPLFVRDGEERLLLVEDGASLALKGRAERYTEDDVVARLTSGAWLPSFSALTRPLAASVLYPIGATILGPAEVAYWAQAWPLFAWAEIVPPAVLHRPLVALETPAARRLLAKLGITLADVLAGEDALLRHKGGAAARAILWKVAGTRDRAVAELEDARPELLGVDPTLARAVAATREKVLFSFDRLIEKTEGAAGRADALVVQQIKRVVLELVPNGRLAERVYPVLPYVLKLGREAVVGPLRAALRWDESGLQEISL